MHHLVYPSEVDGATTARANQIFFLQPEDMEAHRQTFEGVQRDIVASLLSELEGNPLMAEFKTMGVVLREEKQRALLEGRRVKYVALTVVDPAEVDDPAIDKRRYELGTAHYEVKCHFCENLL